MQCVRCKAEDTATARFCRVCGYPCAFEDFMSCPVCGGEVRAGNKICPGCQHQFAVPMLVSADVRQRSVRRWPVIATGALGLLALFLFFGAAEQSPLRLAPEIEAHANFSPASQVDQVPIAAAEPEVAKSSVAPAETVSEFGTHAEPIAPFFTRPKATIVRIEPEQLEVERPAQPAAHEVGPTAETPAANGAAGPKADDSAVSPPLSEPPHANAEISKPSAEISTADKSNAEDGSVDVAARANPGPGVRGAPVVERSRVAAPSSQTKIIARDNRSRDGCQGKWEGECRQFPDHKPNW